MNLIFFRNTTAVNLGIIFSYPGCKTHLVSTQCHILVNYEVHSQLVETGTIPGNLWALSSSSVQEVPSLTLGNLQGNIYWLWLSWVGEGGSSKPLTFSLCAALPFLLPCPVPWTHLCLSGPSVQFPHDWSWSARILFFVL